MVQGLGLVEGGGWVAEWNLLNLGFDNNKWDASNLHAQ